MPQKLILDPKRWKPPKLSPFLKRCKAEKELSFTDDALMIGEPDCHWQSFRRPLLRHCSLSTRIDWGDRLGYGVDGIVWKITIDQRTYALKVFWDNSKPGGRRYWAIQRECHNAALISMIRASFDRDNGADPIALNPEPQNWPEACQNLHAFSDEGRRQTRRWSSAHDVVYYRSLPKLRQCYGWRKISGRELLDLDRTKRPPHVTLDGLERRILEDEDYYAIVYEYIPHLNPAKDSGAMQTQMEFFWRAGFCFVPERNEDKNWADGVLLDMADIICPWHAGWQLARYKRQNPQARVAIPG